jgi:hypothetical protein
MLQPQYPQQSEQFPQQQQVAVFVGVPVGAGVSAPPVPEAAATPVVHFSSESVLVQDAGQAKGKKSGKCWKCAVDSHATKDCPVQYYCLVCDNFKHPTMRCPTLRLPRPLCFVTGEGTDDALLCLPDSVHKAHLAPTCSPTTLVTISGDKVPAKAIQDLMKRICPLNVQWKWEAVAHGDDAFLIGFPSAEDLQRVDGFQMGVPSHKETASVSVWKPQDIQHKSELKPVWVHVEGVPYTVRHFHGLWAVASLLGVPLDVDLVTLRSRGVVRIFVAMVNPKALEGQVDETGPFLAVACAVKLKLFGFVFRREPADFVADPSFTPYFWRRKGDDVDEEDLGNDKDHDSFGPSGAAASEASNMDVDSSLPSSSTNKGKSDAAATVLCPVITPYNAFPRTPRGN